MRTSWICGKVSGPVKKANENGEVLSTAVSYYFCANLMKICRYYRKMARLARFSSSLAFSI